MMFNTLLRSFAAKVADNPADSLEAKVLTAAPMKSSSSSNEDLVKFLVPCFNAVAVIDASPAFLPS